MRTLLSVGVLVLTFACSSSGSDPGPLADSDSTSADTTSSYDSSALLDVQETTPQGKDTSGPDASAKDTGPPDDAREPDVFPADAGADSVDSWSGPEVTDAVSWDAAPDLVLEDATGPWDAAAEVVAVDLFEAESVEEPQPLFDHEMIRDESTAACTFTNKKSMLKNGVLVDVWNVSYYSWEYLDGGLQPILMRGFAARPSLAGTPMPGVVQAHGLGGFAKESHATGTAALLGMFVLAYTGPGGGDSPENTSGGLPSGHQDGYRMFDTLDDLRGSWFWGHSVAAMRALTCVEHHPDVDPTRLGVTGYSAGGVATSISSGVDDRIKAAVPLSGTLAWGVATEAEDAWQHNLLTAAGLSIASQEWLNLLELVNPQGIMGQTGAKVLMVNGSTDEFFPLTAHMATFNAIPGGDKRTTISANFDHGCYILSGGESEETIAERAALRAEGGQRLWFRHWFGTDENYTYVPAPPTVEVAPIGAATMVSAIVDPGGSKLEVEHVKVWWSNDHAFLFFSHELKPQGGGLYSDLTLFPLEPQSVYFVDVQYKTKNWLTPERFSISSPPTLPDGFVPHIRDVDTCL